MLKIKKNKKYDRIKKNIKNNVAMIISLIVKTFLAIIDPGAGLYRSSTIQRYIIIFSLEKPWEHSCPHI